MKLSRRFELLPPYAFCLNPSCAWADTVYGRSGPVRSAARAVEAQARAHVAGSGHEVRVSVTTQVIFRPETAARPEAVNA